MKDVLVVDDDAVVRDTLQAVLTAAGYEVNVAANAFEALMELRMRPVHAILCDVKMPYVEGTTFYHQLVEEFPELGSRVVFISGSTSPNVVVDQTGRPCLTKPFEPKEVLTAVRAATRSSDPAQ